MSIVPISDQQGTIYNPFSPDLWDPFKNFHEDLFSLDLWVPFTSFPFRSHFPEFYGEIFPSLETQINWRDTPKAHVFKAVLPGLTKDDVIIVVDEENMLQISTEDGKFMSRFKLPQNAKVDQVKASMENGVLTVTVAKEVPVSQRPNVRVVEISG